MVNNSCISGFFTNQMNYVKVLQMSRLPAFIGTEAFCSAAAALRSGGSVVLTPCAKDPCTHAAAMEK